MFHVKLAINLVISAIYAAFGGVHDAGFHVEHVVGDTQPSRMEMNPPVEPDMAARQRAA